MKLIYDEEFFSNYTDREIATAFYMTYTGDKEAGLNKSIDELSKLIIENKDLFSCEIPIQGLREGTQEDFCPVPEVREGDCSAMGCEWCWNRCVGLFLEEKFIKEYWQIT